MPRSTINFDTVRKIGLAFPDVEESTAYESPALKVRGKLLACVPAHRSAEPNSIVVRVDFDDRAELLAAAPDVYYVTDHYLGYSAVLGEIKINFPDARLTILNSVAEGEWVVVRCTYSGTHRGMSRFPVDGGMLVGVQPTGRTFEVQHIHMFRVLGGKIAEHFASRDDVGMMRQLGLLPPPSSPSGQ